LQDKAARRRRGREDPEERTGISRSYRQQRLVPQIFHRSFNTLSRLSIIAGIVVAGGVGALGALLFRSPYITNQGIEHTQPIPFSHQHHFSGLGIDCRYCHFGVERAAFAGVPPTQVCMNCHSQIWQDSPTLEPVRASFRNDDSIQWVRVHSLPHHVYFDHQAHLNKGVGCSTCHGRVDKMELTFQASPLTMQWCLECHRSPERFVRPKEKLFEMGWQPPADQAAQGAELVKEYDAKPMTHCSTCHR
jgi:hypothetical protein